MIKLSPIANKCALSLFLLGALQQCTLPVLQVYVESGPSSMPAASYFYWIGQAEGDELELESLRLRTLGEGGTIVTQVQNLMLLYHQEEAQAHAALIEFERDDLPDCDSDRQCRDYRSFAPVLSELVMLRLQLRSSNDAAGVLEDRIRNLDQQIEALTNIEQQLLERDQRAN